MNTKETHVNKTYFDNARMYWIHALTPLHVGSGRGVGFVDLPIMREKITGWPIIPGSSVKGVWLDYSRDKKAPDDMIEAAFGRAENDVENDHAGSLAITDARIVLFPVRSLYGTFAYVTSPLVLTRLVRDMEAVGITPPATVPQVGADDRILVTQNTVLTASTSSSQVFFEDLDFRAERDEGTSSASVKSWAEFFGSMLYDDAEALVKRLAIVSDSSFDFLCMQGTEVNTRIRIDDEKKTAAEGALWNEESLPSESLLAGIVWCNRVFGASYSPDQLLNKFCLDTFGCQMGGKATTGKGYVRCLFKGRDK